MAKDRDPVFGSSFWLSVLITTTCGFELAMVLFMAGGRIVSANGQTQANFWFGEHAPVRDVLEIGGFIGTFFLFVVAAAALPFTRKQLGDAEKARLASVYLEISAAWSSPRLVASRMYLLGLRDKYHDPAYQDANKAASCSVQDYIKRVLLGLRKADRLRHHQRTFILTFLEDIALLCANDYVRESVILDFIGAPIVTQMSLLDAYVAALRDPAQTETASPTAYCHATDLCNRARTH